MLDDIQLFCYSFVDAMHENWVWRQIIGAPKIPININQTHDLLVSLAPNLEP